MTVMKMNLEGDGCWPDLADKAAAGELIKAELSDAAMLIGGMSSGKSSVAFRVELPDGKVLFAEQSLDQLEAFVRACRAREQYLAGQS